MIHLKQTKGRTVNQSWNDKYNTSEYYYGIEPNEFFKAEISNLPPGKLLLIGEGEGRNAVYAAGLGWEVDAIDFSEAGKIKTLKLAKEHNVSINYQVVDIFSFTFPANYYDAISSIYIHLEENERKRLHRNIYNSLNPNGIFIFEAFDIEQLSKNSGGPKDISLLYSMDELVADFINYDFLIFGKENIYLTEGKGHNGEAVVIRFKGVKK